MYPFNFISALWAEPEFVIVAPHNRIVGALGTTDTTTILVICTAREIAEKGQLVLTLKHEDSFVHNGISSSNFSCVDEVNCIIVDCRKKHNENLEIYRGNRSGMRNRRAELLQPSVQKAGRRQPQ